ncbi:hypothetical protein CDL15_Pgr005465 [Punica granatum]|uniref:Uncharacterized protein n=1 Tax=Punica granatum TaxID=22663 RepID=A0A218WW95_PUNGR|nr:hypothetical protein CDL15_Pgr005465 [Punica granatum]
MVCFGIFFKCKHHRTVKDYVISAAIILGIIIVLRIICHFIYVSSRRRRSRHGHSSSDLEMQPR